ncbi:MAG: thioredoxin domain-containing protein [Gordonia sp. (in: high G+C Gram-positive bacteria)]|uniref:DsbA family protein n=1 Tax=Gordonia sp. (in: high G+C Gram-positive bacteria) TaxID=84139 RepID=UPI0039E59318
MNDEKTSRGRRDLVVLGVLVLVLVGLVVAVIVGRTGSDDAPARPSAGASTPAELGPLGDLSRRDPKDRRAKGDVDAPVVMVMYSDFRCPFCAAFTRDVEPKLVSEYVDTGRLRIEWRDHPLFGEQSELAARAGWAAAAQGRFWRFTESVYRDAPASKHPDLPIETLVKHAEDAGVADLDRFRRETLDSTYDDAIAGDVEAAERFGIVGVPAFVIDGEPIVGAHPVDVYETVIDRRLGAS